MPLTLGPNLRPNYAVASSSGAVLDCSLDSGTNLVGGAPTDNTALLNTLLAGATAAQPAYLLLDGPTMCTGLLIATAGHTIIEGLGWDCGIWIKSGSNKQPISNHVGMPYEGGVAPAVQGANLILRHFRVNGNRGDGTTGDSNSGDPKGTLGDMFYAGIDLANIDHVRLEDLWIYDAPTYAVRMVNCNDVVIDKCRFEAPSGDFNTDGLHIDGPATDVRISDCYFKTGDDAIAFNAPEGLAAAGNINRATITNCVYDGALSGVRAYGYVSGSSSWIVSNIAMSNCNGSVIFAQAILGFTFTGTKPTDQITNYTATNCQFTVTSGVGNMVQVGDPVGVLVQDNITWMAPIAPDPWIQFLSPTTISDLQFNNCKIYRSTVGSSAAYAIQVSYGSVIKKVTFSGFSITDEYGQSYGSVPYLIDLTSTGAITQIVINSIDPTNISALIDTATHGWAGITQVSGPGVLATGWQFPDSVMANNTPYLSATAPNAGKPCIKISGTVKVYTIV